MCGRYVLYGTDKLAERYGVKISKSIHPNYNTAPTQTMPVITSDGLKMMRWGLIPPWAKDEKIGYKLFNARSETVFEKPMWKKPVMQRRCLIPANGFYEWKKLGKDREPYFIHFPDDELFSFAGIWESWKHEDETWETYSILTTTPNKEMEPIHDRMPVILHKDDEEQWLAADNEQDIAVLLQPYEDGALETYEVGATVGKSKVNEASLMAPLNSK